MLLVRNIMHCKPGKAKEMVSRFRDFENASKQLGLQMKFRVLTDVAGERFWTVISEIEVKDMTEHDEMHRKIMAYPDYTKNLGGYHDIVESGRREIYKIEE